MAYFIQPAGNITPMQNYGRVGIACCDGKGE